MLMHRTARLRWAATAALSIASPLCLADEVAVRDVVVPLPEPAMPELQVPVRPVSELGRVVDPGKLAGLRGGDGSIDNLIDVDGTVEGNTADRIISGSNTISDGAFNNASGINTVIQNTGTNVLIQNAMIVTVDFVDPVP